MSKIDPGEGYVLTDIYHPDLESFWYPSNEWTKTSCVSQLELDFQIKMEQYIAAK